MVPRNKERRVTKNYSVIVSWFAILCIVYATVNLYLIQVNLWTISSVIAILSFIRINLGNNFFVLLLNYLHQSKFVLRFFIQTLSLSYFVTSIYGFISIVKVLPIVDKSVTFLPVLAISFLFGGSAIGLFYYED